MTTRQVSQSERQIGFVANAPEIVMEEAADRSDYGLAEGRASAETRDRLIERLMEERLRIIDSGFNMEDKLKLLESNRKSMASLRGYSFGTGKVIYAILLFSAFVLLTLSWLTAFHHLDEEITITFAGTVVGGTIATIAQKLARLEVDSTRSREPYCTGSVHRNPNSTARHSRRGCTDFPGLYSYPRQRGEGRRESRGLRAPP